LRLTSLAALKLQCVEPKPCPDWLHVLQSTFFVQVIAGTSKQAASLEALKLQCNLQAILTDCPCSDPLFCLSDNSSHVGRFLCLMPLYDLYLLPFVALASLCCLHLKYVYLCRRDPQSSPHLSCGYDLGSRAARHIRRSGKRSLNTKLYVQKKKKKGKGKSYSQETTYLASCTGHIGQPKSGQRTFAPTTIVYREYQAKAYRIYRLRG
jgi:hypothetical protein